MKEDVEDDETEDRLPSVPSDEPEQTRLSKGEHLLRLLTREHGCYFE